MRGVHVFMVVIALTGYLLQPTSVAHAQTVATSGTYNNDSPTIQYTAGIWTYANGATYSRAMNSDLHVASTNGATVTFTFQGSRVSYWYSMAYNRGSYQVFIDDNYIEQVSAYDGSVMRQIGRTWTVANPNVAHVLKIVFIAPSSGTYLDVDGFSVNVEQYPISVDADSSTPAIRRIGSWIQDGGVSGAYLNSLIYSNVAGDLARYTYTGDIVYYEFSTGPNYGIAKVFVDGVLRMTIDQWSATYRRRKVRVFNSVDVPINFGNQPIPTLPFVNGYRRDVHVIEILVTGTRNTSSTDYYVDVDRIYSNVDTIVMDEAINQTQSNWCWATVAQIVGQYTTGTIMSPASNNATRQCNLVTSILGGSCPNGPNVTGGIWDIRTLLVNQYNTSNVWTWPSPATLSEGDLRSEILASHPVIERWDWGSPANGHFIVIRGFDYSTMKYKVIIPDNNNLGLLTTELTYAQLVSGSYSSFPYSWIGYITNIHR